MTRYVPILEKRIDRDMEDKEDPSRHQMIGPNHLVREDLRECPKQVQCDFYGSAMNHLELGIRVGL